MKKLKIFAILILALGACNDKPTGSFTQQITESKKDTANSKYNQIGLQFENPIVLDSSNWVIYPLSIGGWQQSIKGFKSSRYNGLQGNWNIAFYNTETKQSRLLSDSLKMLINSINPNIYSGQRAKENERLIYYSITTNDYNQDGNLYFDDPKYLFISDISGQNFKQVSPDNFDLIHWQTIIETNKILVRAKKDVNGDKKFDSNDEIVSFIYDIDNQKIEEIFNDEFNLMTKKLFATQWTTPTAE
jgi:hypothetical protein